MYLCYLKPLPLVSYFKLIVLYSIHIVMNIILWQENKINIVVLNGIEIAYNFDYHNVMVVICKFN